MKGNSRHAGIHFGAGAIAGIIAGMVMGLAAMTRAAAAGMSFWLPMEQIAATFYGPDALLGGIGPILVGTAFHLGVAACLGGLVGLVAARRTAGRAFGMGLAAGVIIWLGMAYVALPLVDPVMRARVALLGGWWFVYHLIFGCMLFLVPLIDRMFEHGAPAPETGPADLSHA